MPIDDLFSAALESLRDHVGERVRYQRGANDLAASSISGQGSQLSHTLPATIGETKFMMQNDRGSTLVTRSVDFLIGAGDLTFLPGGLPAEGDTIERTIGRRRELYEVVRFNQEPCWLWSDPMHTEFRIHTKLLKSQTPSAI